MGDYKALNDAVISGNVAGVGDLVPQNLDAGNEAGEILNQGLISAMDVVGERMESGDMFIPEVLMSAQAMGQGVEILKPLLKEDQTAGAGKVIIGTVKGDLHDIGKNLVAMMVGGAPVTQAFADEIGADGFAPDAGSAAKMAKTFTA